MTTKRSTKFTVYYSGGDKQSFPVNCEFSVCSFGTFHPGIVGMYGGGSGPQLASSFRDACIKGIKIYKEGGWGTSVSINIKPPGKKTCEVNFNQIDFNRYGWYRALPESQK